MKEYKQMIVKYTLIMCFTQKISKIPVKSQNVLYTKSQCKLKLSEPRIVFTILNTSNFASYGIFEKRYLIELFSNYKIIIIIVIKNESYRSQ